VKKHLVISGRVQGVGFRYWLQRKAEEKNIFGWVKNKIEGDVEALIIGGEKEINDLIKLSEKYFYEKQIENALELLFTNFSKFNNKDKEKINKRRQMKNVKSRKTEKDW